MGDGIGYMLYRIVEGIGYLYCFCFLGYVKYLVIYSGGNFYGLFVGGN